MMTPSQRKLLAQGLRFAFGNPGESGDSIGPRTEEKAAFDRRAAKQLVNGITQGWEHDKGGGWK